MKRAIAILCLGRSGKGIVRIPVEAAKDLVLKKGLPVEGYGGRRVYRLEAQSRRAASVTSSAAQPQQVYSTGAAAIGSAQVIELPQAGRRKTRDRSLATQNEKSEHISGFPLRRASLLSANAQDLLNMKGVDRPTPLKHVGIDQKLDSLVPLDLQFKDETGKSVKLGDYFGKRPVILAPVYYECPMLCTQILNGLVRSLKAVTFNPGQEFEVVVFSFDARDTSALAAAKKECLFEALRSQGYRGWLAFPDWRSSNPSRL